MLVAAYRKSSVESDGIVAEVLLDEPLRERLQVFAGARQDEGLSFVGPAELEAGGQGRNPDLADGSVGSEDKFGRWCIEEDVQNAILLFGFKVALFFCGDQAFLQGFEGRIGFAAEGEFVKHKDSLQRMNRQAICWTAVERNLPGCRSAGQRPALVTGVGDNCFRRGCRRR